MRCREVILLSGNSIVRGLSAMTSTRSLLVGLLLALAFAAPSASFAAGTVLIGSQSIATGPDSDQSGQAEAFQFAATSSGTVSTLTVYLDSGSSSTKLITGLYANSGSNPGALLGQGTSTTSLTAGAWNTVAITPVNVTAGTVYWISILGTGGTLKFRDSGANCVSQSSSQTTLTSLPATWSVGSRWFSCTLSAYGSASSATPVLSATPAGLSFSGIQGSSTNPSASTINVANTGGGSLTFTSASDSPWLAVTPASGTAPQALQVSATIGSLVAGTYNGNVTVTSSGTQGSPVTIPVTFTISVPTPSPVLSVSTTVASFNFTQGSGSTIPPANVNVTNTGGGSLAFTASNDSPSWLSVAPASGSAPQTVQVSAIPGTLLPGTYVGHVTVTSAGVQGSPATITATLVVAPADVAPVISAVTNSSPTASGTVITWTTDKAASSQVNYGATSAYGSSSTLDPTLVTSHSVTLAGLAAGTLYHYQVQSADASGTLSGSPDATFTTTGVSSNCPCSIWPPTATPQTTSVNDPQAVELGVKFTSDVGGYITGIRFYKGTKNSGTHTGSLWTSKGTLLATATFTGESSSGWQQVNFSSPVAVSASTTYVASYHTNTGSYAGDTQFFSSAVSAVPLHALSNGSSGGNGVYVYGTGGVFPTATYQSTNYWVDVVFNTTQVNPGGSTFSISGNISPTTGGSGATVTLSGGSSATTLADSSGNYSFSGLSNGAYTIKVTQSGYSFSPSSQSVTVSGANVSGVNFTASSLASFSISGSIIPSGGVGRPTLTLTGAASATTTARSSGTFTFSNLANGTYTVTPSNTGYTFTPASQTVTINGSSITGLSFTATQNTATTYTISGTVTGASGTTLTLAGTSTGTTSAGSSGDFSFSGLANGSYTVTPSRSGFSFSPASLAVTVNGANVTAANFTATALGFNISGTLSPVTGGSGATVTLSGAASATSTSDGSGNFVFTGVKNGTYAVTPSQTGYSFSPTTQSVTVNSANVTGVNFTAAAASPTYTLSGSISPSTSGSGVLVSLTGVASASTTTDSSGNFTFTSLANGAYTVTPSSQAATFSPVSQAVTISNANVTGLAFTATPTSNIVFFDDFLGSTLSSQWVAMNRAGDYSNGEEECYSPSNVSIASGNMVEQFIAQKTSCGDSLHSASQFNYSSAMVQWNTFNFTYGTVEVRAKMANTSVWPAIWLLGANCQSSNVLSADNTGACNWPQAGSEEIDIAEFAPNDPTARENIYARGNSFSCGTGNVNDETQFHVYTFTWTATSMNWAIDGTTNCKVTQSNLMISHPMFLMINIAANNSATPQPPQYNTIDYVKVTQP
jgi:beta-glucanase (GH16 family)